MTFDFANAPVPAPRPRKPGHAYRYLVERQTLLAKLKGISLTGSAKDGHGEPRYHHIVDTNVFGWDGAALDDFRRGQGNEEAGKIKACHSSSALACSLFNVFRKNPAPMLRALDLPTTPVPTMSLERVLRVLPPEKGGYGGSPNYDCCFEYGHAGPIAAVEVKYSEWASPRPHPPLKPKYLNAPSLWDDLPRLKLLARDVIEADPWQYLDAPQLIRHTLGLHLTARPYRLYYVWVDVPGDEGCQHRREIAEFRDRLDHPDLFIPMTVQDIILGVAKNDYAGNVGWLKFMAERYL